jgi:hypothetical protein
MTGDELRQRVQQLGVTFSAAAGMVGLSRSGLYQQMTGERRVSRQTQLILDLLEHAPGRPGAACGSAELAAPK